MLDDSDCMVDIARYFLRFTQDQSCGKCTLCRIGTRRMLDILDRICVGEGQQGDLEELEQLAITVQAGSICGLGRTAPNPVLSTLRYFRHEYEAHLAGRCPAGKCKDLIHYRVTDECIGCTLCAQQCPADAIPLTPYAKHGIDQEKCTRCDTCRQICPDRRHRRRVVPMPKLTIDQREVEVPEGRRCWTRRGSWASTIPALCFREGCEPSTSCLVCLVRINGDRRLVPSCATKAAEGMRVESETEEVHAVRRTALELLLSDHLGDCLAPCQFGCPAGMDIPTMLRQIAAGQLREAIVTVKRDIALPAVLGRICPAPCEKVCRRGNLDASVSICGLKRWWPTSIWPRAIRTCRRASHPPANAWRLSAAGPTGLSAAYYLRQSGHACTIFDESLSPGGRLRDEMVEGEIATIVGLGVEVKTNVHIGSATEFSDLQSGFDAVLIACGATAREQAQPWGLTVGDRGIQVRPKTYETNLPGVFAAGMAVRGKALAVRSVADGKEAAVAIDQFLCGLPVTGAAEPFSTKIGRMDAAELTRFAADASDVSRQEPGEGFSSADGVTQAARCLHCDCRSLKSCKLRKYAAMYDAQPRRYKAGRRVFEQDDKHAEVIYEPGKCIDCGLCIQIAAEAGEPLGLTFVGRGFDVRVAVPLDRPLADALTRVAAQCVAACPTAALAWKREP